MTITVYSDVVMPNNVIAAGVRGKQIRRNSRATTQGGYMTANILWSRTLRQYELGYVPMLASAWAAIEGLHEVTEGGAYGFLMQDPKDQSVTHTTGLIQAYNNGASVGAMGGGYGVPTYKLNKRYTSSGSSRTKDRGITRPKATPVINRGGAPVTLGASAGNAAINYDTGTVTFVADSSSTVTAVTVGATTQVTLTAALAGLAVGKRLYLIDLTGTVGATLNGTSHAITAITGGGLNVYTLSVVTTGLAWASAGSGYAYPQSAETLTWAGDFYIPVHFESDEIDWELVVGGPVGTRLVSGPNVVLMEIRE
jgi:uncharacterized protein (TIGR02217 family)